MKINQMCRDLPCRLDGKLQSDELLRDSFLSPRGCVKLRLEAEGSQKFGNTQPLSPEIYAQLSIYENLMTWWCGGEGGEETKAVKWHFSPFVENTRLRSRTFTRPLRL